MQRSNERLKEAGRFEVAEGDWRGLGDEKLRT